MQEQFSLAYIHMIASAAGCTLRHHATDYDGVDLSIYSSAQYDAYDEPSFDIQLKCTTQRDLLKEDHLVWNLKAARFTKIANPKRFIPGYLGVLLVPDDPDLWLQQDEGRLMTQSVMYWQRGTELGTLPEGQASKDVHLPRSNIFDVTQLLGIMAYIGKGGDRW